MGYGEIDIVTNLATEWPCAATRSAWCQRRLSWPRTSGWRFSGSCGDQLSHWIWWKHCASSGSVGKGRPEPGAPPSNCWGYGWKCGLSGYCVGRSGKKTMFAILHKFYMFSFAVNKVRIEQDNMCVYSTWIKVPIHSQSRAKFLNWVT